jgi:hypothetical protein
MFLLSIFLVSTVNALTISPDHVDITVEKGEEVQRSEYIQISNSAIDPIHVYASVSGPISQFISLEKNEFDLPAGPGSHSGLPRKAEFVKLIVSVPREVPQSKYSGEIVFTEQPTTGGVLGTSVQLGVKVNLNIGSMAKVEFPIYVIVMIIILIILIILFIVKERMRRSNE